MPSLHGYFAKTVKGDIFLPIKNTFTEGETVRVQITKEPREEKVATATLDIREYPILTGDEISIAEMDALIATAMDTDIPFGQGAHWRQFRRETR